MQSLSVHLWLRRPAEFFPEIRDFARYPFGHGRFQKPSSRPP
jgi:hypothetical protein